MGKISKHIGLDFGYNEGDGGWGPGYNKNQQIIDGLLHLAVLSASTAAPPASPTEGDRYIVPANATGAWAGNTNAVAYWDSAEWLFLAPQTGWRTRIVDTNAFQWFDGTSWSAESTAHGITVEQGGSQVATGQTTLNFVGAEITSDGSGAATVTIPHGFSIEQGGSQVATAQTALNIVGGTVTSDGSGTATLTIPAPGNTGIGGIDFKQSGTEVGTASTLNIVGGTVTADGSGGATLTIPALGAAGITVKQAGSQVATAQTALNVIGGTVTSDGSGTATLTIPTGDTTLTINTQSGSSYTLALNDSGSVVEMGSASANVVTVPSQSAVAFQSAVLITVSQIGAGATKVQAAAGVTLNGVSGGSCTLTAQWDAVTLYRRGADAWVVQGAHGGVS